MAAPAETIDDIKSRVEALREMWGQRNADFETYRDLFFLNHYNGPGEGSAPVAKELATPGLVHITSRHDTPTVDENGAYRVTASDYTDYILAMRSMMGSSMPIISCSSDKMHKVADDRIRDAEKLLMAVLYVTRYRSERDIMQDFLDSGLITGWACVKAFWDEELEKEYRSEDSNWTDFPLVLQVLPPDHAYMREGGRTSRWSEFAYAWTRPIRDIEDEWGVRLKSTRGGIKDDADADETEVLYIDYWWYKAHKLWHTVVAGEDFIKKPVNVSKWYRSPPYTMIPFLSTSSTDPRYMSVSTLMAQRPNVEMLEDLLSRVMTTITYNADPIWVAQDAEGKPMAVDKSAGAINHIGPGQDLKTIPGANTTQDVYQMISYTTSAEQRAGLPSITYGQGMSGLSGYAISLMGSGGQMKSVIPLANIEAGLSLVFDKILDIFRRHSPEEPIASFGQDRYGRDFTVRMTGNELKGIRVNVKLKPKVPQDEVARANRARLLKGIVSDHEIKENVLELQDPKSDTDRQMVEAFKQAPPIMAVEMAMAARDYGYPESAVQGLLQMAQQEIATSGGMSNPGARAPNAGPPMPQPGAQMAPQTPDELAMQQALAAQGGRVPEPERPAGSASALMSQGGLQGGGF